MKKLLYILCAIGCSVLWGKELKIVSLSPGVTDAICAIGGVKYLCGRSSACNAPEAEAVPVAGKMGLPAMEKIVKLRPTHIISDTRHPDGNWRMLEQLGIKVMILPGKNVSDHAANLRKLGTILKLETQAEAEAAKYERRIRELQNRKRQRKAVKVLLVLGMPGVISCGKKSFLHEAVTLAGGENICGKVEQGYFTVSAEYILKAQPEAIICAGLPMKMVKTYFARGEYRNLPAVKQGRFIEVDADSFCRVGGKLPDAISELSDTLSRIK